MAFPGEASSGRTHANAGSSSSPSKSPLLRPDNFRKVEKIGQGSWGEVSKYELVSNGNSTGRFFAVKRTLPVEMTNDPLPIPVELENLERLYAYGGHPNIVRYHGYFLQKSTEYIHFVFELASGGDVQKFVDEKGTLSEREAATITGGLLRGLDFLHSHGIVHRDLKLNNLLLEDRTNLNVKITDFASARRVDSSITKALAIRHTAPESLAGSEGIYNQASEMFAAGILVHELLTGAHPFDRRHDWVWWIFGIGTRRAVCRRRIRLYRPNIANEKFHAITPQGQSFIHRLLAETPEERPTARYALEDAWLNNDQCSCSTEKGDPASAARITEPSSNIL